MDENINITEKQRYVANFDQKIYNQFKKIAKENNESLNWFLNLKIEELKDRIKLKKYEENNNYKGKMIYLTEENHQFAKNMLYIYGIKIRNYIQSVMEATIIEENKEQPQN
jgi:pimeloyl-CoA synthetase